MLEKKYNHKLVEEEKSKKKEKMQKSVFFCRNVLILWRKYAIIYIFWNMQNNMQKPHNKSSAVKSLFKMLNFKNLEIDGDISLILGIMLLLSGETYDELLNLALLYIMMWNTNSKIYDK